MGARYQENKVDRELVFIAGADGFPPSFAPGDLIVNVLSPENESYDTDAITGSASVQYAFVESDTQAGVTVNADAEISGAELEFDANGSPVIPDGQTALVSG